MRSFLKKASGLLTAAGILAVLAAIVLAAAGCSNPAGGGGDGGGDIYCTITFESNGGSSAPSQSVKQGEYAVQPAPPPARAGFGFAGWYTDPAFYAGSRYTFTDPVWYAMTLYAKWGSVFYTVSFDTNGGDGPAPAAQEIAENGYAVRPPDPVKAGCGFAGWYDSTLTTSHSFTGAAITAAITLYAKWNDPITGGPDADDFGVGSIVNGSFDIANLSDWQEAVAAVNAGGGGSAGTPKNYIFTITADFALPGIDGDDYTFDTFTVSYITLSLRGADTTPDPVVSLDSKGRMLLLTANQTVIVRDLTLKGYGSNDAYLIDFRYPPGSALHLKGTAKITGNTGYGGVYVFDYGGNSASFTMTMEDDASVTGIAGDAIDIDQGTLVMRDNASVSGNVLAAGYSSPYGNAIEAGSVTMEDNAVVADNRSSRATVYATSLTMRGNAEIHDNRTDGSSGGGVSCTTLLMEDSAKIYNNTVNATVEGSTSANVLGSGAGGGVSASSVFMRDDAQVYNNTVNVTIKKYNRNVTVFLAGGGIGRGGSYGWCYGSNVTMEDNAKIYNNALKVVKVENTSGINPVVCFFGGGVEGSITMSGQTEVYGNTTSSVAGADVDSPIGGVFSGSYFAPVPSSSSSVSTSGNVTVTLSGSASIRNNTGNGLVIGGALTMEDSASVHHNTGGGITISSEDNTNSVMRGNAAVHDNGAKGIYISGDGGDASRTQTFTMEGSATVYNNVGGESGAVYVSNDVSFTMRGSAKITGNTGCGALIMSGSAFIMEGNAEISNNNNTSGAKQGGGVYVSGNSGPSSFTMRDNAKITGNTASYGGGIFSQIHNLGEGNVNINIRDNAVISGNTASLSGGGVELEDTHSTYIIFFYMGGGTIFGNSEGANSNTVTAGSGNGAALYNYNNNAIARYGTFTGNTFTQNGGLTTRDTTIKVVGGALVP